MTKKDAAAKTPAEQKPIEEIILNFTTGKYSAIPLASFWAKELRRREENRHLTANELLELALREVLNGSVDWKDVKKAAAAAAANGDESAEGDKKK